MKTRMLMASSAAFMALLGLAGSFVPHEILSFLGSEPAGPPVWLIQIAGALYLGLAIMNWTARGVLIGGIYSRPLALGNFMHFAIVSIVLSKVLLTQYGPSLLAGVVVNLAFAVWFGLVLFTHPVAEGS